MELSLQNVEEKKNTHTRNIRKQSRHKYEEQAKIQHRRWFKTMVICICHTKYVYIHSVAGSHTRSFTSKLPRNACICATMCCVSVCVCARASSTRNLDSHVISSSSTRFVFLQFCSYFSLFFHSWLCKIWRERKIIISHTCGCNNIQN